MLSGYSASHLEWIKVLPDMHDMKEYMPIFWSANEQELLPDPAKGGNFFEMCIEKG